MENDLKVLTGVGVTVGGVSVRPLPRVLSQRWKIGLMRVVSLVAASLDRTFFDRGGGREEARAAGGMTPAVAAGEIASSGTPRNDGGAGTPRNDDLLGRVLENLDIEAVEEFARGLIVEWPGEISGLVAEWVGLCGLEMEELRAARGQLSESRWERMKADALEANGLVLTEEQELEIFLRIVGWCFPLGKLREVFGVARSIQGSLTPGVETTS